MLAFGLALRLVEFALELAQFHAGGEKFLLGLAQAGIGVGLPPALAAGGMGAIMSRDEVLDDTGVRHDNRPFADRAGAAEPGGGFFDYHALPALRAGEFDIGAFCDHIVPHSCAVFTLFGRYLVKENSRANYSH